MVMIQSHRVRKKNEYISPPKKTYSSDAHTAPSQYSKLPSIGKKTSFYNKRTKGTLETDVPVHPDSYQLPPLEPAKTPLPIPAYLEASDRDEELWDELPDSSELDDYLDGRESGLSMVSLWTNQTDLERAASSLGSWGEDEFDQAASKGVADMFSEIDTCLYEGKKVPRDNAELAAECKDWAAKFPHLRVIGKQIFPTEEKGYKLYPRPPSVTLSAPIKKETHSVDQSKHLEIHGRTVEPIATPRRMKKKEETLAEHGTFQELLAFDHSDALTQNQERNQLLIQRKKIVDYLMDKIWPEVIKIILPVVQHIAQQQSEFKERRHSEPVLHATLKLGLPRRRSPELLLPSERRKNGSIQFSPSKRYVEPTGAKQGRGANSAGPPRRLNPLQNTSGGSKKASTKKTSQITQFSKLPPIDIPSLASVADRKNRGNMRAVKTMQQSKFEWQSRTFDSAMEDIHPPQRKQLPLQRLAETEKQRSDLRIQRRMKTEDLYSLNKADQRKPAAFRKKKKMSPSKSASPRRTNKNSSNAKSKDC